MMVNRVDPLDLGDFVPDVSTPAPPPREIVEKVANKHGFPSRQAKPAPAKPALRRRRTGRTEQLVIRVTPDVMDRFRTLSDSMDLAYGAVLEKLLAGQGGQSK